MHFERNCRTCAHVINLLHCSEIGNMDEMIYEVNSGNNSPSNTLKAKCERFKGTVQPKKTKKLFSVRFSGMSCMSFWVFVAKVYPFL